MHDRAMTTLLIGIILSAMAIGFVVGLAGRRRVRWSIYGALLLAPVAVLTIVLVQALPSPPGFMAWWITGMVMISPAVTAWAVSITAGFAAARWSVR
jgi:hypothetical protein